MTPSELQSRLTASPPPLLVHVLPEEIFAAQHIPGSCNACVYEMAFLDQMAELAPDKHQPVIVHGAGGDSMDAEVAATKLKAAGYDNVTVFGGGLDAWSAVGLPVEGDGSLSRAPSLSGTFRADTAESVIRWTGRNLFNHHSGTVKLASGEIVLRDNTLASARFTIAMNSIACEDLTDSAWNQMLIQHLQSDDFFDVANHPTAEFVADAIEPLKSCTEGTPNYRLRGRFTLRGVTRDVEFPIVVASADGARLTAQGVLDLDRTQFGSVYGSGKFFRFLGKHVVNDHIHLHVKLHAENNREPLTTRFSFPKPQNNTLMSDLFTPLQVGALTLPNRILMAPLTRCRADADHVPTALMAEYYSQRASAGLIIAEATMAMEGNSSFWMEPGIYSDAQVEGWKTVTDAVHAKGGRIVLQLWHGGRACHPLLNNGAQPVAPSAIPITGDEVHTPEGKKPYVMPRELRDDEIPGIIAGFKKAAKNAKAAGFDGVEVHGANGYLLDEFLRDGANKRTGPYGGPIENRARLLLEVVEAVSEVWGSDRVGVRISPLNSYNSMIDSDPVGLTTYVATRLNGLKIAYLHMMRSDFFQAQQGDVMTPARNAFKGVIIGNMGYTADEATLAVADGKLDAVAFGTQFLANPDLPARIAASAPLNAPDAAKFYSPGAAGYTDYPALAAA